MKPTITLCVLLLSLTSLFSQDHAPTTEQCRADVRLWTSDYNASKDAASKLSLETIKQRSDEMIHCAAVDSENGSAYFTVVAVYGTELGERYKHFIERQSLMAQFLAEDAAGKR